MSDFSVYWGHFTNRHMKDKVQFNFNRLLSINNTTKTIKQKRLLAPPTLNAMFRDKVREEYPDYTHEFL